MVTLRIGTALLQVVTAVVHCPGHLTRQRLSQRTGHFCLPSLILDLRFGCSPNSHVHLTPLQESLQ